MIDNVTKRKIVIELDEESCPFADVSSANDADRLAENLARKFHILSIFSYHEHLNEYEGKRLEFGALVDPQRLQEIIDTIE
ncbi:hypothetical protein A1OO_19345 [Enterovibrio norvegicus FF-33]|uniref:Uncharacterized protein n=1 Tax=Enterovibrio norvegicus FF-454 TaxID=1185651 RepID=A0A1E5C1D2_9GAMM|nr:hypothetical protein [Enterovibrio norvegicus]OEE58952.1 hypothetical protein A1OK_02795 [Enterovibrio norvegicus FF-454]OEE67894.1 hypothetical protein A1OO_19345 [Enterovibrio norvegicus FF-33]OEE73972.1 hypothetical protein A1OQ_10165 [Enterovibrio norvegicus FF-162]